MLVVRTAPVPIQFAIHSSPALGKYTLNNRVCKVTWYFALLGISPHTFPGPFGVDNRTRPRPYPSTCLETLDFEARELLVHRDDRRYGPNRDT